MNAPYRSYQVYILTCADGSFYTGASSDLEVRLAQHAQATFPKNYTVTRRPVTLAFTQSFARKRFPAG